MPDVFETYSGSSVYPDFETLGDHEGISGRTGFGRNAQIHDDLIKYLLKLKAEGRIPKDGFHVYFPAMSVGCEPYYFAMLAKEAGLTEDGQLTIHASDLKEQFIKYAQQAQYSHHTLKELPKELEHYFRPLDDGKTFQLSSEIVDLVTYTPHGDLRDKVTDQKYDAIVMPHLVYHYLKRDEKRDLLKVAFNMSRGMVMVENASFDENASLFEEEMLRSRCGMVNDNLEAVELQNVRERTFWEKYIPFVKQRPVTDIHRSKDRDYFSALRL